MDLIATDECKVNILNVLIANILAGTARVHLYSNDVTITNATVIGDFTECSGSGYGYVVYGSMTTPAFVSGVASSTVDPAVFSGPNDGSDIYGCFITDPSGDMILCGRFDSAPLTMTGSQQLQIDMTNLTGTVYVS